MTGLYSTAKPKEFWFLDFIINDLSTEIDKLNNFSNNCDYL